MWSARTKSLVGKATRSLPWSGKQIGIKVKEVLMWNNLSFFWWRLPWNTSFNVKLSLTSLARTFEILWDEMYWNNSLIFWKNCGFFQSADHPQRFVTFTLSCTPCKVPDLRLRVHYLAKWYVDMQSEELGNQTSDHQITGRPPRPHEPQPPQENITGEISCWLCYRESDEKIETTQVCLQIWSQ